MCENPNYYAILPAKVRYDKELKANEKLLYAEITALANKKGYCYATNTYFSELYGVTVVSVSNWISTLVKKGYIHRELIKDSSGEIVQRNLYLIDIPEPLEENFNRGIKENFNTPIKEIFKGGIKENFKENNTSINNTSINIYIVEIVEYLNKKTNKNYKPNTSKTRSLIQARINEGFTIKDFKKVIDIKTKDWLNDKKMNRYLRPETLFGSKFESYLNEEVQEEQKERFRIGTYI